MNRAGRTGNFENHFVHNESMFPGARRKASFDDKSYYKQLNPKIYKSQLNNNFTLNNKKETIES